MSSLPFYPPTAAPPPPPPPPPPPRNNNDQLSNHLNLRYATALSLGFILCFALILISYICFRLSRRRQPNPNTTNPNFGGGGAAAASADSDNGIILSRRIFVGEEEDDEENAVIGLDEAVINSYPKFPYVSGSGGECAICLCEYKDGDMLRMLPDCRHLFHLTCVDEWLRLNASCPVCRNSPLPTPLSTPLSEVVPLSLYTDGRNRRR